MKRLLTLGVLLAACAPFQQGGFLNPTSVNNGSVVQIPRGGEVFLRHSVAANEFSTDLVDAYLLSQNQRVGTSNSVSNSQISFTLDLTRVPSGWALAGSDLSSRAVVYKSIQKISPEILSYAYQVDYRGANFSFSVTPAATAQNGQYPVEGYIRANGIAVPFSAVVEIAASPQTSTADRPITINSGGRVPAQPGVTTYVQVLYSQNVAYRLEDDKLGRLLGSGSQTTSESFYLPNPTLELSSLPQGLSAGFWNTEYNLRLSHQVNRFNSGEGEHIVALSLNAANSFFSLKADNTFVGGNISGFVISDQTQIPVQLQTTLAP